MREFEGFLKNSKGVSSVDVYEIDEMEIRDMETFETLNVKARFSRNPEKLNNPDRIWIGFEDVLGVGKEPWYIEICETKEEEVEAVEIETTKVKVSLGQRRGSMIRSLLEEREKKEGDGE